MSAGSVNDSSGSISRHLISLLGDDVVLLRCNKGEKGPRWTGWQKATIDLMRKERYLKALDKHQNIAVLLGSASGGLCSITMRFEEIDWPEDLILPWLAADEELPGQGDESDDPIIRQYGVPVFTYDPTATCPRFLNELLLPAVHAEDAILLQKMAGLCLLGENLIQRFLILDGEPGRGKSQYGIVLQYLVGRENVTQLRTYLPASASGDFTRTRNSYWSVKNAFSTENAGFQCS